MRPPTPGLHHVSAIAGEPQANVDFYADVLGLPLVKQTVNFEDKFMYHLYYGDERARPGTLLTFFPYMGGQTGRIGKPQPSATAFAVPADAVEYWADRLAERGIDVERSERFGDPVLGFRDHDGLSVELVGTDSTPSAAAPGDRPGSVPAEHAIRCLQGVTLLSTSIYHTAAMLEVLGFELLDQEGERVRYRAPGEYATVVDLIDVDAEYGREGIGTVHHVAFRPGEASLPEWRERLSEAGLEPTRIKDRYYFESVYFREPGGILFEIATEEPGFAVDEQPGELGTRFRLPPWFEEDREMIEGQLPSLSVPGRRSG